MLRKNWNPNPRYPNPALKLRIPDSGFLIIYEKPADPRFGFRLPSLKLTI